MTDSELLTRLEKLERDNRRLKRFGVAALALAAGVGVVAAARPIPNAIKAHEFDVGDNAGKVRTELTVHALRVLDKQGKARLAAGIDRGRTTCRS